MKAYFSSKDSRPVRWQWLGIERLRQALQFLQGLLAADQQPRALALIPIRDAQPHVNRRRHQRTWRD